MTAGADRSRELQISDEFEDTLGRCPEYLEAVCRDAVPVDPEVQAILDSWRNGGTELPWSDAAAGDNQEISEEQAS